MKKLKDDDIARFHLVDFWDRTKLQPIISKMSDWEKANTGSVRMNRIYGTEAFDFRHTPHLGQLIYERSLKVLTFFTQFPDNYGNLQNIPTD